MTPDLAEELQRAAGEAEQGNRDLWIAFAEVED